MRPLSRVLLFVSLAIGVGAGFAMYSRVAEMPPFLDITPEPAASEDGAEAWNLVVRARGDETIDEIRVESLSPDLKVRKPSVVQGMARGSTATFRLLLDVRRATKSCGVRVSQSGTWSSTHDLQVGAQR